MPEVGILYPWDHQRIKDDAATRQQNLYAGGIQNRLASMQIDDYADQLGINREKLVRNAALVAANDPTVPFGFTGDQTDNPLADIPRPTSPVTAPTGPATAPADAMSVAPAPAGPATPGNSLAPTMPPPSAAPRPAGNPLAASPPNPEDRVEMNKFIGEQQAQQQYRQQVYQQQTAQAQQYYGIVQEPIEEAKKSGDMKMLRKILEQSVTDNPGNQVIAQKSKTMLAMMDNGVKFGPGQTASMELNVPGRNTPEFQKIVEKLSPFLPEGIDPTPGTKWKINVDGKRITSAAEVPDGSSKEPASTEANYRQGLEAKLRADHPDWTQKRIQFEAAKQVREENASAKEHQTKFIIDYKGEKKTEADVKKEESRKSPDEEMLPMAMEYFVTHKLPGNMRDPVTQKQFRRVFNNTLKQYGISPETWAKMGPDAQASQKALTRIKVVNAQVARDEETARTLLKNVVTQGKAIQPYMSGFKKLDDWVNHLQSHYKGNPKAVNVENTIYEALVDYGKVMGGNIGAGGLTDSARKEAQALLTAGMAGGKDIQEIVDNMISNMEVRTKSNKVAEKSLNDNITGVLNKPGEKKPLGSY